MKIKNQIALALSLAVILSGGGSHPIPADARPNGKSWYQNVFDQDDDDDYDRNGRHRERKRERRRNGEHREKYLKPVSNPAYKERCGACHLAYQPELLPSAAWAKILADLADHFGGAVEIDAETTKVISDYLAANGAENSSAKQAVRIMQSLRKRLPPRITDIPYIRAQHHEISADVIARKSIGSLSNCSACHTTAEAGLYDDDNVKIPE